MAEIPSEVGSLSVSNGTASDNGVFCSRCERLSLDKSFCEHCQCELPQVAPDSSSPPMISNSNWSLESICVNWPEDPSSYFLMEAGPMRFRVRAVRPELWQELSGDVRSRQSTRLRVLPPLHVTEMQGGALLLAECWKSGKTNISEAPLNALDEVLIETLTHSQQLARVMTELHNTENVWFEFDPEAVETKNDEVRIVNMDWRLFPLGRCPARFARVSPKYSPPEVCRFRDELIGPRTDVFHLALSVYYRLADLGRNGIDGRGLEAFGFEIPPLRVFRQDLPTGIWPVLRRALSVNPNQRPSSAGELFSLLEAAIENRAIRRQPVRPAAEPTPRKSLWRRISRPFANETDTGLSIVTETVLNPDVGFLSIAGRAKSASGSVNQDCVVVQKEMIQGRQILLMVVADGVTHARVGTGDRASGLGCEVLLASIRQRIYSDSVATTFDWPQILDRACLAASEAIVADAFRIPDRPSLIRDNDLMSTTALIGVLDGCELYLANVGDSRAYLVANGVAEQLTVDGDVACFKLGQRVPPEQVQELGTAGKALRFCLGACREGDNGQLQADPDRAHPSVSRWQVERDDIVVLCTDGLVEEGVFLDPEDLVRICDKDRNPTSQLLAEQLVNAANEKQRLPSQSEPNGYGDNITCLVLRMVEGPSPHDFTSRKG